MSTCGLNAICRSLPCVLLCSVAVAAESPSARQILDVTGVRGGLIVHLGCGDGKLTAALRTGDSFIVHGLDADAKNVEAGKHIRSLGIYGAVSVEKWDGTRLPYADNIVNLIVTGDDCRLASDEILRAARHRAVSPSRTVPASPSASLGQGDRRVDTQPARAGQQRRGARLAGGRRFAPNGSPVPSGPEP